MSDFLTINVETLKTLSTAFGFKVHGDHVVKVGPLAGLTAWDLEFSNLFNATAFVNMIMTHVVEADIRQGDCIQSLWSTVTLTLVLPAQN